MDRKTSYCVMWITDGDSASGYGHDKIRLESYLCTSLLNLPGHIDPALFLYISS